MTAALLENPVHRGEAEAGSLAELLRGEERLEDAGPRLRVHPRAAVGHRQAHVAAGLDTPVLAVERLLELHRERLDRQRPAVGHRVTPVHREVEEDLLELTGVGQDRADRRVELHDERDVLADQAVEHLLDLGDDLVQVEQPGPNDLLTAEREELLRERGGSCGGALDLFELVPNVALGDATRPP